MVNVTKDNFLEISDEIISELSTATFVAIDEEMTGIFLPGSKPPPKDDTPSQRYERLKQIPERYSIIQLGISIFSANPAFHETETSDPSPPELLSKSYNLYIFPRSNSRDVTLSPSAVTFLNNNGMDLGLWTKQGVPFCSVSKARDYRSKFQSKHDLSEEDASKGKAGKGLILTRSEDIGFVARTMASIREWLDIAVSCDSNTLTLPPCNSYLRRALYETIEREYPHLVLEKSEENWNQIVVLVLSPEEKILRKEKKMKEDYQQMINQQIGVCRIFEALSHVNKGTTKVKEEDNDEKERENKKVKREDPQSTKCTQHKSESVPIVTHNGFMDILFLLTHFHSHTLPDTWPEAKQLIAQYFPFLYDTKVLSTECSTQVFESTALADLYNTVYTTGIDKYCQSEITNHTDVNPKEQLHEAAYDAYMTGCAFYALTRLITQLKPTDPSPSFSTLLKTSGSALGLNQINLMQTMFTIDLSQPLNDPFSKGMTPSTTYRICDIDSKVSTRDIAKCLENINHGDGGYDIVWIDQTNFMVSTRLSPNVEEGEDFGTRAMAIRSALRTRFPRQDIVTMEDYFKFGSGMEKKVEPRRSMLSGLFEVLGGLFGRKRKRLPPS